MSLMTFVIPVRHQANSKDWQALKRNLTETVKSIANQTHSDWNAVIVANEGADLPVLPPKFSVASVDFPPNLLHDMGSASREQVLDAFRLDKGRRVLAGMLKHADSTFFMIVDDDDFVSSRLVEYVSQHTQSNGWRIDKGYIWGDQGNLLMAHNDFGHLCGTSLIIRGELYHLPRSFENAGEEWIKDMLGSHQRIGGILEKAGRPLGSLPFPGAIYRIGHAGSHSKAPGLIRQYILNRGVLRRPKRLLSNLSRLRLVNNGYRREFFGGN